MDERIQELHKEYTDIPIPDELDLIVNRSIKQSLKANRKKHTTTKWVASVGAAAVIF